MQSALPARSKLPDVGTTIFTVIGQLAAQYEAVNLSQGAPNFAPDTNLVDSAVRAMRAGHHQYAPMAGIRTLRQPCQTSSRACTVCVTIRPAK